MKHFAFVTSSLLLCLFFLALPLQSKAEGGGLTVEPAFQEVSFEASVQSADFFVTLHNTTGATLVLRPSVIDFGSLDESGGVAFLGENQDMVQKYALATWVRLESDRITLEPDETKRFQVVIENSDALSPGGHYGAILFKIGDQDGAVTLENRVAVNQIVSVLVFAKKMGGEVYELSLSKKEWPKGVFLSPTQTKLSFENTGNVHVVPRGLVTLVDPLNRIISKGTVNPESGLILPEASRQFTVRQLSLAPALIPGWYTLSIAYRYDGKDEFVSETEAFFLFPWQSLVCLLCFVGMLWFGRHFLQKKHFFMRKK